MNPLNTFFDEIFVINREARTDRRAGCSEQFEMFGIRNVTWFTAHEGVVVDGRINANAGCTASHRALLEIIAHQRIPRALILEDDFQIVHGDFSERFEAMARELEALAIVWDMLYLGGHYGEAPIARLSPHVIRCGRMLTTSSYGITWQIARKMAPYIGGIGPIDSLYGGFHRENTCLILDPRLMIQRPSYSDLQEREMSNAACMLDDSHVRALDQK